jgi:hypothetical protein
MRALGSAAYLAIVTTLSAHSALAVERHSDWSNHPQPDQASSSSNSAARDTCTRVASNAGYTDEPVLHTEEPVRALWSSLERPPTPREAQTLARNNTGFAEFDFSQGVSADAIRTLREAGIKIFAYNVGNGGGSAWGEASNILRGPHARSVVKAAAKKALMRGADGLHLDNVDMLDSTALERLMDAQVEAAHELQKPPALHLKNSTTNYLRVLRRRPDLRAATKLAVVEHLSSEPAAAQQIAKMRIPVYGIEFARSRFGSPTRSVNQLNAFLRRNCWVSGIWAMPNEDQYEARSAAYLTSAANGCGCSGAPG